jgi:hypothetical protein
MACSQVEQQRIWYKVNLKLSAKLVSNLILQLCIVNVSGKTSIILANKILLHVVARVLKTEKQKEKSTK